MIDTVRIVVKVVLTVLAFRIPPLLVERGRHPWDAVGMVLEMCGLFWLVPVLALIWFAW